MRLDVTRCYSIKLDVPICHSMRLDVARCYSMKLDVPICHSMRLDVTRCYSMKLDVPICYSMRLDVARCYSVIPASFLTHGSAQHIAFCPVSEVNMCGRNNSRNIDRSPTGNSRNLM
ncbi:hypothetical protein RRG08_050550 [Elysia crispata]|uniref:Uncharacterized protein n=1 Tax=Elysia crispata TaxID=231223 RepID=A0AAE0Z8J0_9GAST|nr:hypothetical protein RRG08_050550 [Elysia crispata]